MIRNDVPRNAQEPTAERRAITATGDAAKGAKEDVLSDFFGNVAIRQSPGREIVDTGHVASIELGERSGIPELGLGHELGNIHLWRVCCPRHVWWPGPHSSPHPFRSSVNSDVLSPLESEKSHNMSQDTVAEQFDQTD